MGLFSNKPTTIEKLLKEMDGAIHQWELLNGRGKGMDDISWGHVAKRLSKAGRGVAEVVLRQRTPSNITHQELHEVLTRYRRMLTLLIEWTLVHDSDPYEVHCARRPPVRVARRCVGGKGSIGRGAPTGRPVGGSA